MQRRDREHARTAQAGTVTANRVKRTVVAVTDHIYQTSSQHAGQINAMSLTAKEASSVGNPPAGTADAESYHARLPRFFRPRL